MFLIGEMFGGNLFPNYETVSKIWTTVLKTPKSRKETSLMKAYLFNKYD